MTSAVVTAGGGRDLPAGSVPPASSKKAVPAGEVARLYRLGLNMTEIAGVYQVSEWVIAARLDRAGVRRRRGGRAVLPVDRAVRRYLREPLTSMTPEPYPGEPPARRQPGERTPGAGATAVAGRRAVRPRVPGHAATGQSRPGTQVTSLLTRVTTDAMALSSCRLARGNRRPSGPAAQRPA